jgi:hypothetical protein
MPIHLKKAAGAIGSHHVPVVDAVSEINQRLLPALGAVLTAMICATVESAIAGLCVYLL